MGFLFTNTAQIKQLNEWLDVCKANCNLLNLLGQCLGRCLYFHFPTHKILRSMVEYSKW